MCYMDMASVYTVFKAEGNNVNDMSQHVSDSRDFSFTLIFLITELYNRPVSLHLWKC